MNASKKLNVAILAKQKKMHAILGSTKLFSLEVFMSHGFYMQFCADDKPNFRIRDTVTQRVRGYPYFLYGSSDDSEVTTPDFRIYVVAPGHEG